MVDYSICDLASHASVHKHGNISVWNCSVFQKLLNDPLSLTVHELALVLKSDVVNYSPLAKWLVKTPPVCECPQAAVENGNVDSVN
jgi:hypothetical protein